MHPWFVKDTAFSERITFWDKLVFMRVCPERRYRKGEAIFYAGDPATDLHVIAKGQVKLVSATMHGNERIVAICGPNDFIGEAFLRDSGRYRADAVALTDAVTCPVSRQQFRTLAKRAPQLVLSFTEILADQLVYCREQLRNAYDPVKLRVVKALLEQAQRFGQPASDGATELRTELRHDEIASLISATRVSVSTALAELRSEGLVMGSRGHYLLRVAALQALLEPTP